MRDQVLAAADALATRPPSKPLDESLGAKDWRRLREEWLAEAKACGPGWLLALTFDGNIAPPAPYTPDLILVNDDTGAPPAELKAL